METYAEAFRREFGKAESVDTLERQGWIPKRHQMPDIGIVELEDTPEFDTVPRDGETGWREQAKRAEAALIADVRADMRLWHAAELRSYADYLRKWLQSWVPPMPALAAGETRELTAGEHDTSVVDTDVIQIPYGRTSRTLHMATCHHVRDFGELLVEIETSEQAREYAEKHRLNLCRLCSPIEIHGEEVV